MEDFFFFDDKNILFEVEILRKENKEKIQVYESWIAEKETKIKLNKTKLQ